MSPRTEGMGLQEAAACPPPPRLGTFDRCLPHPQKLDRARCLGAPSSFPSPQAERALDCRAEKRGPLSPVDRTEQGPIHSAQRS